MSKTIYYTIIALGGLAMGLSSIASAAEMEAPCILDRYLAMRDRNYTLVGGLPPSSFTATVYKFDISGLSGPVQSASLVVDRIANKMRGASETNPLTVYAKAIDSDVADWTSMDTSQFGETLDSVTFTGFGLHAFDVTALVNAWISGDADNNGIALMVTADSFETSNAAYVTLAGVPNPGYDTELGAAPVILATVPEPTTLGLVAAGGVALWRKRRRP